jgi:hypothetical protein
MMALGEDRHRIDMRIAQGLRKLSGIEVGGDIGNEGRGVKIQMNLAPEMIKNGLHVLHEEKPSPELVWTSITLPRRH